MAELVQGGGSDGRPDTQLGVPVHADAGDDGSVRRFTQLLSEPSTQQEQKAKGLSCTRFASMPTTATDWRSCSAGAGRREATLARTGSSTAPWGVTTGSDVLMGDQLVHRLASVVKAQRCSRT